MDISGKTAIVTGAASGIGLGIATALAEAGANVVMADIHKDAVEQAAHGLSATNKRVKPVRIDVRQEPSVLDALTEAERNFGKLHIACNNAGVPMHGTRMVDVPPGDWEFVIGVNIWGIIRGIRHFVPAILKHGEEGHIVNTASSTWAGCKSGRLTKRYCPSAWPPEVSIRGKSANAWSTRSRQRHSMRLSAPSPPMSSGPATAASRTP